MKSVSAALFVLLIVMARPSAQAPSAPDVVGEWEITTISPIGENTNTMAISKEGETLKAVAKSPAGERPYDRIQMSESTITLVMTVDFQGSPMIITYQGTTDGKEMNGAADFGGLAEGSWSAKRKPDAEK